MSSWPCRARAIIIKWNPPINVLERVFHQGPGRNKPENACSTLIGEFHLMILLVCSYPWGPNGILRFWDKLFSRGWANRPFHTSVPKNATRNVIQKTAILPYHATAAYSCPKGWSSCPECPSIRKDFLPTRARTRAHARTFMWLRASVLDRP